jgi:hypothetical protein
MGVDFIRNESGKPWRKRWYKGRDLLKIPSLFDVEFSEQQRLINVDLDCDVDLRVGDQVIVQLNGSATIVSHAQLCVGRVAACPDEIRATIAECGGVALGTVERISLFGNNAELSIR